MYLFQEFGAAQENNMACLIWPAEYDGDVSLGEDTEVVYLAFQWIGRILQNLCWWHFSNTCR